MPRAAHRRVPRAAHVIQKPIDRDLTCSVVEIPVAGWGASLEDATYQGKERVHTASKVHNVLDVEFPSDAHGYVLNCVRLIMRHHHFED